MKRRLALMSAFGLAAVIFSGGTTVMAQQSIQLEGLKQPPLNTTMMGMLKAVADYHGLGLTEPMIFGLSGHAFLINIHTQLCPSGPYCWKRENAEPLIENMGLRMTDFGFFDAGAKAETRTDVEHKLREALDRGIPCSLINLENQVISGYDGTGFFSAQPWAPNSSFPPGRLTFGSWKEFGEQFHVNFYKIEKVPPAERQKAVLASLDYAIDMWTAPGKHSSEAYGVGPNAYDNWIKAVPECGASHGNWWNATVWSECRRMAAGYFSAIGNENKAGADLCAQLRDAYIKIADNLGKASNKAMNADEKIALLKETKALEASAINMVKTLGETLRAGKKQ
ncbi:MAG: BtrH N-terminal domain-containing protein [Lentisphaerae bacterium]|nr:BtrH N-terminal domain-containing protein [Lentisphaerota bacterium]